MTSADLSYLTKFASFRLARVGLPPGSAEDLVQDAFLAVLKGAGSRSHGRHPRPSDLMSPATFIQYLKGVIISLVSTERRHRQVEHQALDPNSPPPDQLALHENRVRPECEFRDLQQQLFNRLLSKVDGRLRKVVIAWQQQWDSCDRIPVLGYHRRCRAEVRLLAADVFDELVQPAKRTTYEPSR